MQNEPLGLPKGSVRAILILAISVGSIIGIIIGPPDVKNRFFDLLKVFIPLYIGSRVNWDKTTKGE